MTDSKVLFQTFYNCQSLVYLSFGYKHCPIIIPECGVSFPNLNELIIRTPKFPDAEAFEELLSGCPVLQSLSLYECDRQDVKYLSITKPSLTKLTIESPTFCSVGPDGPLEIALLDTPHLESLTCYGSMLACSSVKMFEFLREADIHCRLPYDYPSWGGRASASATKDFNQKAAEIFMACTNLETLFLRMPALIKNCLSCLAFQNLKSLKLATMTEQEGWNVLHGLLECTPNLETLDIFSGFSKECYKSFISSEPAILPICFLLHLKVVLLRRFEAEKGDIRFIE